MKKSKKNKGTLKSSRGGQSQVFFSMNGKVNYHDKSRRHVRERRGGSKAARKPAK